MDFIEIFSICMSSFTGIAVAVIGYLSVRREHHDKQYRKLREELDEQKQLVADKDRKDREEEIAKLATQVDELTKQVQNMNESLESSVRDISNITKLTKHNLEFSNEINNVLMVLSETIVSTHPDKTALAKQIEAHRQRTKELTNNLYQITL